MENIVAPLNIIANLIIQNYIPKFESEIRESSISSPENDQKLVRLML